MDYMTASTILNKHLFEGEKKKLLMNIIDNPERFIGLFRPTKPGAKILQSLLQSHEIRYGDALEELLRAMLSDLGFINLEGRKISSGDVTLSVDQYFRDSNFVYFMEQKVRDDHDSTKKRGQIQNFEKKLNVLMKNHPEKFVGMMFFIDPSLVKNKNFYITELEKMREFYKIELHLFYGVEFFRFFGKECAWDNLINWLTQWKNSLPDLPEINFDSEPEDSYNELKKLDLGYWRRLIMQKELWDEGILSAVFRNGDTLRFIIANFEQQRRSPYLELANSLKEKIRLLN